jgi:hypothetical protein
MCEVMIISALVVINPTNVLVTFLQFVVAPSQVVIAAAQVAISLLVPVHFRSDPDNFVQRCGQFGWEHEQSCKDPHDFG